MVKKSLSKFRQQIASEYFRIERRTDLSPDQKVNRIIKITASACAGLAIQPLPFADILILTPAQILMATRIAAVRGIPLSENDARKSIAEIASVVGMGLVSQQLVIGAYKTGLPFLGGLMTLPLVFGLTYAIGRTMDVYLVKKAKGISMPPEELRRLWKEAKKEGKERGRREKKERTSKSH